ncbi:tyrosine-protein phosphatase, partial [Erysipelatoclostridium ramosum]
SVPEAVCAALRHIKATRQTGHAVLFHCTAGKDRTGILAALLLKLCGVCNEDILADYQISATYNAAGVNRMLPADVMAIPAVRALFESTPDMLQPLLSLLDQTGCFSYLKSIGMQQA